MALPQPEPGGLWLAPRRPGLKLHFGLCSTFSASERSAPSSGHSRAAGRSAGPRTRLYRNRAPSWRTHRLARPARGLACRLARREPGRAGDEPPREPSSSPARECCLYEPHQGVDPGLAACPGRPAQEVARGLARLARALARRAARRKPGRTGPDQASRAARWLGGRNRGARHAMEPPHSHLPSHLRQQPERDGESQLVACILRPGRLDAGRERLRAQLLDAFKGGFLPALQGVESRFAAFASHQLADFGEVGGLGLQVGAGGLLRLGRLDRGGGQNEVIGFQPESPHL